MFETIRRQAYLLRGRNPPVSGLWERTGDDFAGCVVIVEPVGKQLQGRITEVPAAMRNVGWVVGDVKWKSIHTAGRNRYRLMDLFKSYDTSNTRLLQSRYQPARLHFYSDKRFYVVPDEAPQGSTTYWLRID